MNETAMTARSATWAALFALVSLVLALVAVGVPHAGAASGDELLSVPKPADCGGIGVAFDGADVLYTCANESAVRKMDLAGNDTGILNTVDESGNPLSVDAIAWDPNDGVLWGGDLGGGECRIWSVDPTTGVGTLAFSYVDAHGGCNFSFFDGLTVDTVNDTLWLSPDVHSHIHHFNKDGTDIAGDLIDFAALTPDGEPNRNSGLAIGVDGSLFAATASNGEIFQIDTTTAPATFVGQFASSAGRDEDLECGPRMTLTDGSEAETILSVDLDTPNLTVFEAPEGTCQSPVEVTTVDIDIKPGSDPNSINLRNRGVVPVAILTTDTFDATTVDPASVCFGDAEKPTERDCTEAHGTGHVEDVDGDGDDDLVLHYETRETGIDPGDTEACLTGTTANGTAVEGCDSVRTIPAA